MFKKSFLIVSLVLVTAMPSLAFQDWLEKGELKRIDDTPFIEHPGFHCGYQHLLKNLDSFLEDTSAATLNRAAAKTGDIELEIGDVLEFTTVNFRTSGADRISAELRHKTDKTYIFVERDQWQSGRVVQSNIDAFHNAFEVSTPSGSLDPTMGIREIEETHIGLPPNKAGDGFVYILIHDIQDNYNAETNPTFIAGYFNPTDQSNGANSNRKDIIYVDSFPNNPSGQFALLAVAHEYQHLIHHRYDSNEQTWLNEGASEYAQHITGFGIPTPNRFFSSPGTPMTSWSAELADYERTGLFMVYMGDQFGTPFISRLIQDSQNGPESVSDALTAEGLALTFDDVFTNFAIANLVNDVSLHPDGYYGYSSFALPILPNITAVHDLYPVDEQNKFLSPYSAAYYLFAAEDTTAVLNFSSVLTNSVAGNVFEFGEITQVYPIELNSANQGEASLAAIGNTASLAFLIASSYGNPANYAYSVSSQFEDLAEPVFTLGPRETLSTGHSITIYWETDELSTSVLDYGLTTAYGSKVQNQNFNFTHQFTLSNLQPNSVYHYRISATDQRGNGPSMSADFTFTTTAATVTAIADVQQTHSYGYEGRNIVRSSDDVLHILYHEIVGTRRFVYHTESSDDGRNWSVPNVTDNSMFFGGMPSIAVDKFDRLHMAWHVQPDSVNNFSVFYSRSDDLGASWSQPKLVSKIYTAGDNLYASVAVDTAGNPHVVWNSVLQANNNIGDAHYNYSSDGGETWPDDQIIGTSSDRSAFVPTIEINGAGKAYVFYSDGVFDARNRYVYSVTSEDYQTWSDPEAISTSGVLFDGMISHTIDINNNVHLVFSDNFTPGDIRIMYTQLVVSGESLGWTTPSPAAGSVVFGGQVSYPNISTDDQGNLYLVYIDSQSSTQAGFAKPVHLPPSDNEGSLALRKTTQGSGDAYLTILQGEEWLQPTNVSGDATHSEYVEMPRRSKTGVADIMWMKEFSVTNNQINFISLDTRTSGSTTAPQITEVFPADNAVEVPYFKDVLRITATFDQRVIADSLNASNVSIVDGANQTIAGEFQYIESQKQMVFTPSENIPPSQEITVTVLARVFSSSGLPLDGNGNGQSEGSPGDDFVWRFQTQAEDATPPAFTIGVLQNPVLTRYVDFYVIASEPLADPPQLTLNGGGIALSLLDAGARIYKGDTRLESTGTLELVVNGTDFAQNAGQANKSFSAQLLVADLAGSITSPDHLLNLSLPAGSLEEDMYLTVSKIDGSGPFPGESLEDVAGLIAAYRVGPSSIDLKLRGSLNLTAPGVSDRLLLQFKDNTGTWESVPATQKGSTLTAPVAKLGIYRMLRADHSVPTRFALHQNYPNPFASADPVTRLAFELPGQSQVDIVIYNLLGEKVRTLFGGIKEAGFHEVSWDGRDRFGTRVASGVYFYQLKTIKSVLTRKMLILH